MLDFYNDILAFVFLFSDAAKVGMNAQGLLKWADLLHDGVVIDGRGGIFNQNDMETAVWKELNELKIMPRLKALVRREGLDSYQEGVTIISYKIRILFAHLRIKFDGYTPASDDHDDGAETDGLKPIFQLIAAHLEANGVPKGAKRTMLNKPPPGMHPFPAFRYQPSMWTLTMRTIIHNRPTHQLTIQNTHQRLFRRFRGGGYFLGQGEGKGKLLPKESCPPTSPAPLPKKIKAEKPVTVPTPAKAAKPSTPEPAVNAIAYWTPTKAVQVSASSNETEPMKHEKGENGFLFAVFANGEKVETEVPNGLLRNDC